MSFTYAHRYYRLGLPVDPLLGISSSSIIIDPSPTSFATRISGFSCRRGTAVVVIEGIPPVSVKLVEKFGDGSLQTCWYLKTQGMTPFYLLTMRFMNTNPFHEHRESP